MTSKETAMAFGEKLRFLTGGKSREKIEKAAGLKRHSISAFISHGSMPRPAKLISLSRVLGVSLDWLCDPTRGIIIPEDASRRAA